MVVLSKTLNFSLCAEMPLDTREFVRKTISPSQRWEQIFVKVKASKGKLLRSLRSWGAKFVTNSTCTKGTATTSRAGRSSPSMRPNHNRVTSPLCLACFYVEDNGHMEVSKVMGCTPNHSSHLTILVLKPMVTFGFRISRKHHMTTII